MTAGTPRSKDVVWAGVLNGVAVALIGLGLPVALMWGFQAGGLSRNATGPITLSEIAQLAALAGASLYLVTTGAKVAWRHLSELRARPANPD